MENLDVSLKKRIKISYPDCYRCSCVPLTCANSIQSVVSQCQTIKRLFCSISFNVLLLFVSMSMKCHWSIGCGGFESKLCNVLLSFEFSLFASGRIQNLKEWLRYVLNSALNSVLNSVIQGCLCYGDKGLSSANWCVCSGVALQFYRVSLSDCWSLPQ